MVDLGLIRKIVAWALILSSLVFLVIGIDSVINPKYGWSTGVSIIIIFFIPLFVVGWKLRKEPKRIEVVRPQQVRTTLPPQGIQTTPTTSYVARCEICGNQLSEGDKFCQACGTPTAKKIQPISDTRIFPPEALSYQKQIEKYQKALSYLENQRTIGEVSAESYSMAKANLERELQKLLEYKEEVDRAKKSVIEGIQSKGGIGKADFIKDFNIRSEIVNDAMEQLLKENIIEKTETGERYRLKGKTKRCPYCRGSIPADLSVCPLCGSIIG